jgi:hypothetical protein
MHHVWVVSALIVTALAGASPGAVAQQAVSGITYTAERPDYWSYRGEPVLLIGGSVNDNLFQVGDIAGQLALLTEAGGNYVRNTMSSRDEGDPWPFALNAEGKYDLTQYNDVYWARFEELLNRAQASGVIVQIEIWDRFDYTRAPWEINPYNPGNNVNYDTEASGLKTKYPEHPNKRTNTFFRSVPELDNNEVLLPHQRAFVDKLMEVSLRYDNVLYCISNETDVHEAWGEYWGKYVRDVAAQAGASIHVTEMRNEKKLDHRQHLRIASQPELFSFLDISQNNHNDGDVHWDNLMLMRERVADRPRPINHVKIYGADTDPRYGDTADGLHRFWRNVLGGAASVRFHRPGLGLGITELAQATLRSANLVMDTVNIFELQPANELLINRQPDSAYLAAKPGEGYLLYLPEGGTATIQLDGGEYTGRWLFPDQARWADLVVELSGESTQVSAPDPRRWLLVVTPADAAPPAPEPPAPDPGEQPVPDPGEQPVPDPGEEPVPTDPGEQPVLEPGEDPSKLPFRERVRRLVVPQQ